MVVDGVLEHRVLDVRRVEGIGHGGVWVANYKTGVSGEGESVEGVFREGDSEL